jgi:hypothetical protein
MKYDVEIFATPLGALHMNNSLRMVLTVEAENEQDARQEAIKEAYRQSDKIQHVNPRIVRPTP